MTQISQASDEQSTGIEQINQAVAEMDNVTQQNAALVEQAAAAAESMQEQALLLAQAVSIFKLGDGQPGAGLAAELPTGLPQGSARALSPTRRAPPARPRPPLAYVD